MLSVQELLDEEGISMDDLILVVDEENSEPVTVVEQLPNGQTREIPLHLCFKILNRADAEYLSDGQYAVSELLTVTSPPTL